MSISAKGRVCGLLAYPIGHSLSPDMHNYFSEKLKEDEVYIPLLTKPEALGDAVAGAYAMNFLGMNVTIPHKIAVMDYLSELDASARLVGAVNTLVRTDNGFKGYNTDMYGLKRSILERNVNICGADVIVIGAGGAASAAAAMCVDENANSLIIINRTVQKAEALAEHANTMAGRSFAKGIAIDDLKQIPGYGDESCDRRYLFVQTTNCGMSPNVDCAAIEDDSFYRLAHTAVETIFNPAQTRFMKLCSQKGAITIGGLRMLLYQGVKAYELWNKVTIPDAVIEEAYSLMKNKLEERG